MKNLYPKVTIRINYPEFMKAVWSVIFKVTIYWFGLMKIMIS